LLHATNDNKRADRAVKCVYAARPDCATHAWDIVCERLDGRSFARSLSFLDNLMLRQRPGQSLTKYVHFMRQTFDDHNETSEMIDGFAAINPHNLGLLMLRGIAITGHFGQAKQCVINAFDTNYLLSADEVMPSILHLARNMDEDVTAPSLPALDGPAPPISAFVGASRGSASGRGYISRGTRGGRGLPNKGNVCGTLNHILFSSTTSDDALLKWTLAKWKIIVQKYGTTCGFASAHVALLSDVPTDDLGVLPTLDDYTYEYDDTEVSVPLSSVAFSSSLAHGRDLSQFWVVDSACSITLIAFRSDFVSFASPSAPSRVGGVGADGKGSGSVQNSIRLACSYAIHRTIHALHTPDLSSRSAQHIGSLLIVSWMQSHSDCEFPFPTNADIGLLMVPTRM
jgi:hypothetical protein